MIGASLSLSRGSLELALSPSIGGAISSFAYVSAGRRTPILRESRTPLENVLDACCFPLIPFANRIRGGCFTFRDRTIRLEPNMAGDPSPLHGQGWTSAWSVEAAGKSEAVLSFRHEPGEWPWAYEARQHFRLAADSLHLTLECRNRSEEPMPCGLGFHPYFPCGPETWIRTEVTKVWAVDEKILPVAVEAPVGRFAIADDPVCGRGLDNGYGGWAGRALLSDPGRPFAIEMSSPRARYFQLYSPPDGGFIAAEPVGHANAALNAPEEEWAELGIRVLAPGEEAVLEARIAVVPKQP